MAHEHASHSAFFFLRPQSEIVRRDFDEPLASFDKFMMLNAVETVSTVEP
jgi:hypothetical protein